MKERRKHKRSVFYCLVKYKKSDGSQGIVSSANASAGGALLRLRQRLEIGDKLTVSFNFFGFQNKVIDILTEVVRIEDSKGFYKTAVKFLSIKTQDQQFIDDFFRKLIKNGRAKEA